MRVACAPCPGRTTDGRRSSRRAARALGRARLAREGRRCVPLQSAPDSTWLSRAVHSLYAGFALRRGLSATPRSPVGSRKTLGTRLVPGMPSTGDHHTGARRVQNPGEGVENMGVSGTSGCDRGDTFGDRCAPRLRAAHAAVCLRKSPGCLSVPLRSHPRCACGAGKHLGTVMRVPGRRPASEPLWRGARASRGRPLESLVLSPALRGEHCRPRLLA